MRNKEEKRLQKHFIKNLRKLNQCSIDDWGGRFYFHQLRHKYYYSTGSITLLIRAFDKKTKKYKDYTIFYADWYHTFKYHLSYDIAGDFVNTELNAEQDNIDYTKEKVKITWLEKLPITDILQDT